jgi:hypothetical protein
MGFNKKRIFFGKEIIFNNLGQIGFKKRFLFLSIINYYRYILKGL